MLMSIQQMTQQIAEYFKTQPTGTIPLILLPS